MGCLVYQSKTRSFCYFRHYGVMCNIMLYCTLLWRNPIALCYSYTIRDTLFLNVVFLSYGSVPAWVVLIWNECFLGKSREISKL